VEGDVAVETTPTTPTTVSSYDDDDDDDDDECLNNARVHTSNKISTVNATTLATIKLDRLITNEHSNI
jgi:hypothetical protein